MAQGKTTYHDLQNLRSRIAKVVGEFRRDFPETEVGVAITTVTPTEFGPEKVVFKLAEIPPFVPVLPGFGDDTYRERTR